MAATAPSLAGVEAQACADDRFPRLAGDWLLHCSASGRVDRALHLPTRAAFTLEDGTRAPGAAGAQDGSATLFDPTTGWWPLPAVPGASGSIAPERVIGLTGPFAGPAGAHAAAAGVAWQGEESRVEILVRDALREGATRSTTRARTPAAPVAGEAVVLASTGGIDDPNGPPEVLAAWVEHDGAFRVVGSTGRGDRVALSDDDARLLAADERHLAWVEPDGVVVLDASTRERTRVPARTGFLHAPSLDEGVVCWEERPPVGCPGDIDVRCSDGTVAGGPGDQLAPSRARGTLVFREGATLRVMARAEASAP